MTLRAILFGSIGAVAETSEMQREAFNRAFAEAGLDWSWDSGTFEALLEAPGGLGWIESYNRARGARLDAGAIHARKAELLRERLATGVRLRPGVSAIVAAARRAGVRTALCSTADRATTDALVAAMAPTLPEGGFDFVGDGAMASRPRPDAEVLRAALRAMGVATVDTVVVEDAPAAARSAAAIGLRVVAFPGARHAHRPFPEAERTLRRLDPEAFGLRRSEPRLAAAG